MRRPVAALVVVLAALAAAPSAEAVVGGRAPTDRYPHMAALFVDGEFLCGGSLVRQDWVLTAAHCVRDSEGRTVAANRFTITPGATDVSGGPGPAAVQVAEIRSHPRYGTPTPEANDVALVRLVRPAQGAPIALAAPVGDRFRWQAGAISRLIGFGDVAGGIPTPIGTVGVGGGGPLREVDLPIVSDEDCAAAYGRRFDARSMVCAGEPYGTKDACQGDSGGPLMVRDEGGRYLLVGVVSFGFLCGAPQVPGVYARVGDKPLGDWVRASLPSVSAGSGGTSGGGTGDGGTGGGTGDGGTAARPSVQVLSRSVRVGRDRRVRVRLQCAAAACRGTLRVRVGGRLAGARRFRAEAGRRRTVAVLLRADGRRRLARASRPRVRISATVARGASVRRTLPVRR